MLDEGEAVHAQAICNPIDTAPKDGTLVRLRVDYSGEGAMAAMIDALSRGFYGALYGKSREEIAAALLRSHLIELLQSGAYDALIQPAKRSGGG